MIWQNPIHKNRSFRDWVGHSDCGFPDLVIELLGKHTPTHFIHPLEAAKKRPVMFVDMSAPVASMSKVINMLHHFAPYTDTAFWINGRSVRETIRRIGETRWMEMPLRQAYVECDVLIIEDVPSPNKDDVNFLDALEINNIMQERLNRPSKLTMIFGSESALKELSAISRYITLRSLRGS